MPTMGLFEEACQWLLAGLSAWDPSFDRLLQARALNVLGWLEFLYSISKDTLRWFEESVRLCRSIGPAANAELSWGLWIQGMILIVLNNDWDLETARTLVEESVAVARRLGPAGLLYLTQTLGGLVDIYIRRSIKDYPQIRRLAEENLQLRLQLGDRWSEGQALWSLADIAEMQGDFDQARGYLEQALALYQEAQDKWRVGNNCRQLGRLLRHQGELHSSIHYHQEYLQIWNAMGSLAKASDGLRRLGVDLAFLGGSASSSEKDLILRQAAKMLGVAEKLFGNELVMTTPLDVEDYRKALELLHSQLDPVAFDKAWAEGQAMTLEEAARFALSISPGEAVAEAPERLKNPAEVAG